MGATPAALLKFEETQGESVGIIRGGTPGYGAVNYERRFARPFDLQADPGPAVRLRRSRGGFRLGGINDPIQPAL